MFVKLASDMSRYYADRADLARLQAMDERLLEDIGLSRGDLASGLRGRTAAGRLHRPDIRLYGVPVTR